MALTVDQVLEQIGSLGFYQIRLILILSFIELFNITMQVMVPTFIAAEPNWLCVPNHSECNLTGQIRPGDGKKLYNLRCNMSRDAWKFADDFTSVVTQFDLVCDQAIYSSLSTSVVFAGWLLGAIVGGVLSDKVGRKPVLIVFSFLCSLFGFLASFANVFWVFLVFRLLAGLSVGGGGMGIYVMATEFVGKRHRHVGGTSLWYSWALGLVMLAGLAYLVRDWRHLSIICAAPGLIILFMWKFIPESTRYLLVQGKVQEAENVLQQIATTNKKEYPKEPLLNPNAEGRAQKTGDFRDLFRTKKMLHRTLVSWYSWFVNALVYYGVSFSTPSLGGNMYLNFFLSGVIEIPANYAGIWCIGRFGRKKSLVYNLILAAIASSGAVLLTMYDPGEDKGFMAGRIIMALLAKFFIFIAFDAVYVYAAELFPTVIRNIGMGSSTAAARIGSFCSPYIVHLNRVHPLLPFGIMGANALAAGVLGMTLPETKDMPTAETMDSPEVAEEPKIELHGVADESKEVELEDNKNDISSSQANLVAFSSAL